MLAAMKEEKTDAETPPQELMHTNTPRSFLAFLADQRNGDVVAELSEDLRELGEAIETRFAENPGKTEGELNIKIKLTLNGGEHHVKVEHKMKLPGRPASSTTMWMGPDGNLQRSDPRQTTMPFIKR